MNQLTSIMHALSDENRIRLLYACLDQERCVCQFVELIELSNASISKNLATLRASGLLVSRKDGRWVHYSIPENPSPLVVDALAFVRLHAMTSSQILADQETLKKIDAIDPVDLARMQREGCCVDDACCSPTDTSPTDIETETKNPN